MEVFEKIKSIIVQQLKLEADEVRMEASFADDLGAESIDFVEIIMAMEEEFDMVIPDTDVVNIRTVGEAVKYIQDCR